MNKYTTINHSLTQQIVNQVICKYNSNQVVKLTLRITSQLDWKNEEVEVNYLWTLSLCA